MKTSLLKLSILWVIVIFCTSLSSAQSFWPKDITTDSGVRITIYQPQPEALTGNQIKGRAAFSVAEGPGADLVFGVLWYVGEIVTDRDTRIFTLVGVDITDVRFPGVDDQTKIENFKQLLSKEVPKWAYQSTIDDLNATLEIQNPVKSENLNNKPPHIYYSEEPTLLLTFDGEPVVKQDDKLKMDRVINSPFLILLAGENKKYYLYAGQGWYSSDVVGEGYALTNQLPKSIKSVDQQIKKENKEKPNTTVKPPKKVISSTEPAELIQSDGRAQFANIDGTDLLYMSNSENNIFRFLGDQQYYLLLSGRWYSAARLEGPWSFIPAEKIPADFAKIPEGSPKDEVLVSVPGTQVSINAVHDAQVPQTAKVDRKTAKCEVTYDGEPMFEPIEGTSLELAMNTSSTVLKSGKKYYAVDNGVWFVASNPKGPWKVSDERPTDVKNIPASSPAYNVKYVYIYESTPEVVYVGYTPGYMGTYVYGPTVVYGTGYYYNPWYGPYYYPRPVTYGFSMHYNPWTGWSMGFTFSYGWFSFGFYGGGGYWGPPVYRPPYHPGYGGGIYGGPGNDRIFINNGDINIDRSNNIYNKRNGVNTNDVRAGNRTGAANPRVSTQPATGAGNRNPNTPAANRPSDRSAVNSDVYADRNGNVYQRDQSGNWSQRQGNSWQQTDRSSSNMNRDYQNRKRSSYQNQSFQQTNRGGNLGGASRMRGGRMGGGGRLR